jgi:hypothetical protein
VNPLGSRLDAPSGGPVNTGAGGLAARAASPEKSSSKKTRAFPQIWNRMTKACKCMAEAAAAFATHGFMLNTLLELSENRPNPQCGSDFVFCQGMEIASSIIRPRQD